MSDVKVYVVKNDKESLLALRDLLDKDLWAIGEGRYSTGKIYRIVQIDRYVLVYVGSTIQSLKQRQTGHKAQGQRC